MKKAIAIITIVAALILGAAMSGCTTTNTGGATATPSTVGEVTATPTAGGSTVTGATGAPKATVDGDNLKIAGSQSGNVKVNLKKGGYIMEYKYQGYSFDMAVNSVFGSTRIVPGGQYPGADGWTVFSTVQKFTNDDETEFIITATEPYEINFKKLPLSTTAEVVPMTYSGKGMMVMGPMSLKAGSASFKISAPDLNKAGFSVELFDATTGDSGAFTVPAGVNDNKIDTTVPMTVDADGNYMMKVSANGDAAWTIDVSQ